jgi:hypothetical protein
MGRPSIDPELMIRMLVMGYVFAIRSERLICREVQVNLAYRWFCKLGIEDAIPDHSVSSPMTRFKCQMHCASRIDLSEGSSAGMPECAERNLASHRRPLRPR